MLWDINVAHLFSKLCSIPVYEYGGTDLAILLLIDKYELFPIWGYSGHCYYYCCMSLGVCLHAYILAVYLGLRWQNSKVPISALQ